MAGGYSSALENEKVEGQPLLIKVMEKGEMVYQLPGLDSIRERALRNLSDLPDKYKKLEKPLQYSVSKSPALKELIKELTSELKRYEIENLV